MTTAGRKYGLDVEQPQKSVFVTQLNSRDEDDAGAEGSRYYPVVAESAGQLLETGINTLQKTLLLKREVEVEKVQAELQRKRDEFKQRMEACAQRQIDMQKKSQQMKDHVAKFEHFIADNEGKRRRAIQKYQTEVKVKEQKTIELEAIKEELDTLTVRHTKLLKKITAYRKYEQFLLKVLDRLPENYIEMGENQIQSLMMRHRTLSDTNRSLVDDLYEQAAELERLRSQYEEMKQEHDKTIVSASSEVSRLQKFKDKKIDALKEREQVRSVEADAFRHQTSEYGQILVAISNIADKCKRRQQRGVPSSVDSKLAMIRDYINDEADVLQMAQAGIPSSGRRRSVAVSSVKASSKVQFRDTPIEA